MKIEEPDFMQEARRVIERICEAGDKEKGIRLSAHEVKLITETVFLEHLPSPATGDCK